MPSNSITSRAGRFINQTGGYKAFIPAPLPPDPPVGLDAELVCLLNDAAMALGRLDGLTVNLPNPDLFLSMYVRKEAVLSSHGRRLGRLVAILPPRRRRGCKGGCGDCQADS